MAATISALKYRGWTLVDRIDARYAQRGPRYIYVCRLHEPHNIALARFRALVDEAEG